MSEAFNKLQLLKTNIKKTDGLLVAFSGGVDSTFLLQVAHEVLKEKVVAVTADSPTYPKRELSCAIEFTKAKNIRHVVFKSDELKNKDFSKNPLNRCYICKKELFKRMIEIARELDIGYIADGSNIDDMDDYRPGMAALKELNIISPLMNAGLTKEDIRVLSKKMNLLTSDKPAFACLASRFPYGQKITRKKLKMVEEAEQFLLDLGFKQVRVRNHGNVARIEVLKSELSRFFDDKFSDRVYDKLHQIGFVFVALDLKGYRTGSMNENMPTGV